MKVKTSLLPLLTLGSLSVLRLREKPSQKLAQEAVCHVRCGPEGIESQRHLRTECLKECNSHPRDFSVLNIGAQAKPAYLCHLNESTVSLALDPGVFMIEYRNQSSDWVDLDVKTHDMKDPKNLYDIHVAGLYQWRFTRAFNDGISHSETVDWSKKLGIAGEPDVRSGDVMDIQLECLSSTSIVDSTLYDMANVRLRYQRLKEVACEYTVTCLEVGGTYNKTKRLSFNNRDKWLSVWFEDLPSGANFTAFVSQNTAVAVADVQFSTPSVWLYDDFITVCVPGEVEDIKTSLTAKNYKNIYDVEVTWRSAVDISDYFIVNITTDGADSNRERSRKCSKPCIHVVFEDIEILQDYNVSIRGYSSYLGGGPEALQSFDLSGDLHIRSPGIDHSDNVPGSDTTIAITVSACVSLVVVIGVCVYGRRRRQRWRHEKTKVFTIDNYEIVPGRLVVTRVLGTGAFGTVKLGRLRNDEGRVINVAVKMLRDDANETDLRNFLLEIDMVKSLGQHPNIVCLVDYRTVGPIPLLVLEYCPRGDLLTFLQAVMVKTLTTPEDKEEPHLSRTGISGGNTAAPQENSEGLPAAPSAGVGELNDGFVPDEDATLTVLDMLNFGRQIAMGMEFVASKRIVHRDLAARNVLVCDNRVLKICDFGLSRDIYEQNIYKKIGIGRMPLRWMAIESLTHQVFTTHSDVWSFGILLWEIFTLGGIPYPEVPTIELLKVLQSGYRMKRPQNCSEAVYNLMLACWKSMPMKRPTFTFLCGELDKLICTAADSEYLDVNNVLPEVPHEGE